MNSSEISDIIAYELATTKDVNLAPGVRATIWVLLSLSTIVVVARLLVKWRTTRRLYLDDYLMALALVFGYLHAIFINISMDHGFGRHIIFLDPTDRTIALKLGYISLAWSYLAPCAGRLSFCVFLLYVADTDPMVKKWPIYVFTVLQVLVNGLAVILLFSGCGSHMDVIWLADLVGFNKYCVSIVSQTDYAYLAGSINSLTDLFLTVFPALLVLHTKLTVPKKIGIASLLCLSIVAFAAAILRTIGANALLKVGDYTYDLAPYVTWISVELNIVMIVSSVPMLRPLARGTRRIIDKKLPKSCTDQESWGDTVSLRSMNNSKSQTGVGVVPLSSYSSREFTSQQDPYSITRTVEVSVSHSQDDSPFVHAALVGLVQGEMMERLAGR